MIDRNGLVPYRADEGGFFMIIVEAALAFILGGLIGRFIGMTVHFLPIILLEGCDQGREPRDILKWSLYKPFCWECRQPLSSSNSFLAWFTAFLKKCVHCQHPVEKKRIILEVGVALLFGTTTLLFGFSVPLLFVWAMTALLIACFITDFEHGLLPDQLTLTLVWVGLVGSLHPVFVTPQESILGSVVGYSIFHFFNQIYRYYRHTEGMYPGDFKLNAGVGACLGVKLLIPILIYSMLLLLATALVKAFFVEKLDVSYIKKEVAYACYLVLVTLATLYYQLWMTPNFG